MQEMNVQVYWQSSRVMRAATARQAVLHGEKVDVDKYANEPQAEYQIVLRMEDMTPFQKHDEKFFQDNAFLQMKKGKDKISPTHVVYEKNSKGLVADAIFFFPKNHLFGRSHSLRRRDRSAIFLQNCGLDDARGIQASGHGGSVWPCAVIGCSRIRSYGPQGRDRKVEESLAEFTPGVQYHAPNAFDLKILALYSVCPGASVPMCP
jgi:hypothetical protein